MQVRRSEVTGPAKGPLHAGRDDDGRTADVVGKRESAEYEGALCEEMRRRIERIARVHAERVPDPSREADAVGRGVAVGGHREVPPAKLVAERQRRCSRDEADAPGDVQPRRGGHVEHQLGPGKDPRRASSTLRWAGCARLRIPEHRDAEHHRIVGARADQESRADPRGEDARRHAADRADRDAVGETHADLADREERKPRGRRKGQSLRRREEVAAAAVGTRRGSFAARRGGNLSGRRSRSGLARGRRRVRTARCREKERQRGEESCADTPHAPTHVQRVCRKRNGS